MVSYRSGDFAGNTNYFWVCVERTTPTEIGPKIGYCAIPVNPSESGEVLALLVICTLAVRVPVAIGENETVNVQLAFVDSEPVQLLLRT
jgi:hypothetical protein